MLAWLAENEDVSLEFMHGALERDKREGVSSPDPRLGSGVFSPSMVAFCLLYCVKSISRFY